MYLFSGGPSFPFWLWRADGATPALPVGFAIRVVISPCRTTWRMGGRVMRRRIFLLSLVLALPQLTPAANQNRFIVRTTLGLQSLTQLCLLPTLGCSVVAALDGGLNQLFLLTTPSIVDPTVFLTTMRPTPG